MEDPTEHLKDTINETAEEKRNEQREKWTLYVALSTAFIAVLAAIAGLLAGHHSNEALIDQIRASDQWSYYQAKSIKGEVAASTTKILGSFGKSAAEQTAKEVARYAKEKEEIKVKAEEFEKTSEKHLMTHVTLSKAVTIFQIAIAISAIAILTKRKPLWYAGMALTLLGAIFLVLGIVNA